jgi:hypothetical protein
MFAEWAGSVAVATSSFGGSRDHPLRQVHVYHNNGNFITRVNIETMQPMDIPSLSKSVPSLVMSNK